MVDAGLLLEGLLAAAFGVAVPGGGLMLLALALVLLPPVLLLGPSLPVVLLGCWLLGELLELLAAGGLNEKEYVVPFLLLALLVLLVLAVLPDGLACCC